MVYLPLQQALFKEKLTWSGPWTDSFYGALSGSMAAASTVALLDTLGLPSGPRVLCQGTSAPYVGETLPLTPSGSCWLPHSNKVDTKVGTEREAQVTIVLDAGAVCNIPMQGESREPEGRKIRQRYTHPRQLTKQ